MASEFERSKTEQKLSTLQFQNGKLSAQLQVQRAQISDLEAKLEAQDAKRDAYADTLLTVNSLWSNLNADIQLLSTKAAQVPHCFVASPLACMHGDERSCAYMNSACSKAHLHCVGYIGSLSTLVPPRRTLYICNVLRSAACAA